MKEFSPLIDDPGIFAYVDNEYVKDFGHEMHYHNRAQLLYAEGGIVHIYGEEKHWYLPARTYMWIPAGMPHRILHQSLSMSIFNIYFTVEEEDADFYRHPNIYMVNNMLRAMIHYTREWSGPITEEYPSRIAFLKAIKAILPEMDLTITTFPVSYPYPKDKGLISIAEFLSEHVETSFSFEEIARKFGYSSRTLSRMFQEDIGLSYVRFVRSIRITRALELMAENKLSISEISMAVGYSSLSAFSNIFERVIGLRPSEFLAKAVK